MTYQPNEQAIKFGLQEQLHFSDDSLQQPTIDNHQSQAQF
jgi:hypothetical protein